MDSVTLLLVDDHPLVRDGVRVRLEAVPGFRVVAEAGNAQEAIELAARHSPALTVTDIGMAGISGIQLVEIFGQRFPRMFTLVLSMHDSPEYVRRVVRAGAKGYVLKDAPADQLIAAIRAVMAGGTYFSPGLDFDAASEPASNDRFERLTPREQATLACLALGHSNRQIALKLGVSVRTVEAHRLNLKRKLKIEGQAELVKFAIEHCPTLVSRPAELLS